MVNMITALCGYFSGTFVSDTGGTFKSDTPGTFVRFFVKFGADYPDFERTTFRLNSSNPALPYISLFLFFNLFT